MGFYLRKSIRVGPVRFNLSKSGIGVSGGVKGFRVGTGPRGTYVHMGRGGIYYRKTLSGSSTNEGGTPARDCNGVSSKITPRQPTPVMMQDIDSSDVSCMTDSSSTELLQELNEKSKIPRLGPWVGGGSILLVLVLFATNINPALILICAFFLGAAIYCAFRRDVIRKTVVMFYDFDPALEQAYASLHASALRLAACSGCWHVSASGKVTDRKYHAGASELVERRSTTIKAAPPGFIKTNIETIAVGAGRQTLHFFPDRLLVFDAGRVGAIAYNDLDVNVTQTQFIENSAPRDARVVDQTWKYVNKKGGPDRRFSNNPQLSICLYDDLHFRSSSGLNELIQISQCGIGEAFSTAVQTLAQHTKT